MNTSLDRHLRGEVPADGLSTCWNRSGNASGDNAQTNLDLCAKSGWINTCRKRRPHGKVAATGHKHMSTWAQQQIADIHDLCTRKIHAHAAHPPSGEGRLLPQWWPTMGYLATFDCCPSVVSFGPNTGEQQEQVHQERHHRR